MMVYRRIATAVLFAMGLFAVSDREAVDAAELTPAIIPEPVEIVAGSGVFEIHPEIIVVAEGAAAQKAQMLVDYLAPAMGFRLDVQTGSESRDGAIALLLDPKQGRTDDEAYRLSVTPQRIAIRAEGPAGLFYGIQTLRQLLPPATFGAQPVADVQWAVPCLEITDHPRLGWRGLLIDPARHFIPKPDVLRFVDLMALHKLNRLQIHLTDNHGWRIEIKKYPLLTEIGSRMNFTRYRDHDAAGPAGEFYTQDDIREIVDYARQRHITIVPEIEMPAHSGAAIVAYPQLGLDTEQVQMLPPEERWWKSKHIIAPRPKAISMLQEILAEVAQLFPGQYIHIGGDEANLGFWSDSQEMKDLMEHQGLGDAHQLHSWFLKQMDAFLTERGRRLVGWDEILQGGLARGATVMSWRGEEGGITAARAGHDVVMAPTSHTYFDYYQGPREQEPRAIGGFIPLEKVYQYEPIPAELSKQQAEHVLGAQAQLWAEYIPNPRHLDYMAYPRAAAFCEVVWLPPKKCDFQNFLDRLQQHLQRLDVLQVNYRPLDQPVLPVPESTDANAGRAVHGLVQRLLPARADEFRFEVIAPVRGRDVFEIESRDGKIVIRGNTGVSMAMGLNSYLKDYCHCSVSWCGNQLDLPTSLPSVQPKVRHVSWARYRYFLNYCCFGYSLPWWDWDQWESLIDWMALNGVNAPLAVTGQEAVWQSVCRQLGMKDEEISQFLAGPPYLPFGWMGCLDGWGGPLPQSWIDSHDQLQKKIVARQRELGMTPVLQGFTGHVPPAVAQMHPETTLHKIDWIEWQTHLLDPLDPLFAKVAKLFMEEQTARFGSDHLYAADTFIEMVPPNGNLDYLADLSRAIYAGMADNDPEAVWVLQGWAFMYKQTFWTQPRIAAFLDAIPDDRMVVLDLFCESKPMWSKTEAFCGKPWLWCNVQSFGCTVNLGGAIPRNNDGLMAARLDANRGQLAGLGFVNEGLGYNPVAYDQMFEMAWRDQPVDLDQWYRQYALSRYGTANPSAEAAWQILKNVVYTAPHRTRSIIDQVPTLKRAGGAPYDNVQLGQAWRLLLESAYELGDRDTYQFDLVNIARQSLSNYAARLQHKVVDAYEAHDEEAFQLASENFLQLMRDMDRLVATRGEFLLGKCLEDAKRWGTTDEERAILEWNARRVLTLWGTTQINDYARKEWSGLINGYYLARWQWYLREVGESLRENTPMNQDEFNRDLRAWMETWSDGQEAYPSEPQGDSVAIAAELWAKYGTSFQPDAPSLTTGKPVTCSTALSQYPARLANDGYADNTDRFWAMDVAGGDPAWWQVDFQTPTVVGRVVVVGYYGDQRSYGFTVETSLDGQQWNLVADRRENQEPSTHRGYTCRFEPRPVRYIRVTQTHNSANTGRHLVEVMAYDDQ